MGSMTQFRPCIDLHHGQVKQIVGATLSDKTDAAPKENFVASQSAEWFAEKYKSDGLKGGHIIKLGPGNDEAAKSALAAWPSDAEGGGMQLGGGVTAFNAEAWIEAGASHVIVTSWLFDQEGELLEDRLRDLVSAVGRERLVLDLSCKKTPQGWTVAMNRWQTLTQLDVTPMTLDVLAEYCDEFLIHAADVEGLCQGIDLPLVELLGQWGQLPLTYAGGVRNLEDLEAIQRASEGRMDATVGSALDLFGGHSVSYNELINFNKRS